MGGPPLAGPDSELKLFISRNLSATTRKPSRQLFWALSICAHCRRWAPSTKVFACCQMRAHHREVVLVDVQGARESVGILCPSSEQLVQRTSGVLPPLEGLQEGTFVDLDPDSTVMVDDRVTFVVSCEECAGLSLGHCIDRGHVQLVGFVARVQQGAPRLVFVPLTDSSLLRSFLSHHICHTIHSSTSVCCVQRPLSAWRPEACDHTHSAATCHLL